MKYLKPFCESSESIENRLEYLRDICLDLEDIGYTITIGNVKHFLTDSNNYIIKNYNLIISKGDGQRPGTGFDKPINFTQDGVLDVMERIKGYLGEDNVVNISCYIYRPSRKIYGEWCDFDTNKPLSDIYQIKMKLNVK